MEKGRDTPDNATTGGPPPETPETTQFRNVTPEFTQAAKDALLTSIALGLKTGEQAVRVSVIPAKRSVMAAQYITRRFTGRF